MSGRIKTIGEVLNEAALMLRDYCENKEEDYKKIALMMLSQILNMEKTEVILNKGLPVEQDKYEKIVNAISKYLQDYPLQYCTNKAFFMGLELYVDENVLIPRFDTEVLVEVAIEIFKGRKNLYFLDIGTGSGCIAVALCKFLDCKVFAVDISERALEVARKNAKLNGVENRISFVRSNLFEDIPKNLRFDAIISNPPYISDEEIFELDPRVLKEPHIALFSKEDGLWFFREIANKAKLYLKDGGYIIFEVGFSQAEKVKEILKKNGYKNISSRRDLNNVERCIFAING
ncbi:protein-(glutamine-N5) methyltransferase, release factor-specific [Caldicellulosiruptor kronotskyensis 2002]|uniref:Release factor glutamine methyltransferase n=1 Tax=Caldicellulosiruptor kronotskyensis (strain DSM 18902 / VKM B-2412 / 2002) TaxID=632348 RepID=E4SFF1_CALK2|nr:peptide chain release factor N(5)-glutamine methyltransferase [Caldicellulosiruptor kronotskyensis]ADQ46476.1 protein-(glutamine-N5) methyltransferase, release factor-specific [Caldicellulosiruptor kronotskyensis 2002]